MRGVHGDVFDSHIGVIKEYQGVTELNDNDNRRSISGKNELCDPEL